MKGLVLFPYTVVLMNWAAVVGLYHFLRGQHGVWSGCEGLTSLPKANQLPEPAHSHKPKFSGVA